MLETIENLGNSIRRLRKAEPLTQAQLVSVVGVDESYISKIEADKLFYMPSEEALRLIAQHLNGDPWHFLIFG